MSEELTKCSKEYLIKQLEYSYKEIERLKEENEVLNGILETQRKRKYYSKFLKDFQKENGKNVFPDFDEIYKRYDVYKERIDKAIEYIKNHIVATETENILLDILEGVDKE